MTEKRIKAFAGLGKILADYCTNSISPQVNPWREKLDHAIAKAQSYNPWFTREHTITALSAISGNLEENRIRDWFSTYETGCKRSNPGNIGVIMAGNIPLVGFFDFFYVLMSGHKILAKLSSDDHVLLPALSEILISLCPELNEQVTFLEGRLEKPDAVIATGSDNSFRYFEYYFGKYPHILRKNRNAVAVIPQNGINEVQGSALGKDIFQYFGLGCRNVSKIFIPAGYDITSLFPFFEEFAGVIYHNKYKNNYDYYKSIFLVNQDPHLDNGFMLLKRDKLQYSTPVSVLYYDEYQDINEIKARLKTDEDKLQCVVSDPEFFAGSLAFGESQKPELGDYADGVDVMHFLINI